MSSTFRNRVSGATLCAGLLASSTALASSDKLEISGFGRIVAGFIDDPSVSFEGYENEVSFNEQTLLALQADYHLLDNLMITSQVLAHTNSERDSGVEWFYASYVPHNNWLIKGGRMRTPFYYYSDVIDVGFAYPWISPPQQLYSAFLFNQYDGASVIHNFALGNISGSVEGYYGSFQGDTQFQDRRYATDIDGLTGVVFNGVYNANLRFRASYTTADFRVNLAEISAFADQLRSFGFVESANSLTMEGTFDIYQVGLSLDELDYNLAWEWMEIQSDTVLAPNIESYYIQGGLVFQPFTVHLTYADMATNPQAPASDIPLGLSPDLDQLYYGYQTVFARTQAADLESVTLGVRWDVGVSVTFKAEVTHYRGALGISTFEAVDDRTDFDESVNLYQLGMEFVF